MTNRIRRTMPLLSISIVIQLTELSARQIRYYEENGLVSPARTEGNKRMFSLNDVDALLEVKDLLEQGLNMTGIKKVFHSRMQSENEMAEPKNMSDAELRRIFREEHMQSQMQSGRELRKGDLARFFH